MEYLSKLQAEREKIDAELAIFESFPDEVKTLKFAIFPGKDPWVSFKDCTFETLQIIRKAFPAIPLYWDKNTAKTAATGTSKVLASPYMVKFEKYAYPSNGAVTICWQTNNLAVWCSMSAKDYKSVTCDNYADNYHRQRYESKNKIATPYLAGFGNTKFAGNSITSYCLENQDSNLFEAATFTGSFDRVLPEGEPIKYTLSDDRTEKLGILRQIPFGDVRVGDLITVYRTDRHSELPVFFEILEIRPSGVHIKAFKGQEDWVLYPGNYSGLAHIIAPK